MLGSFQLGLLEEDQLLRGRKSSLSASRYSVLSGVSEVTAETTAIIKRVNLMFHGYWVQVNSDRGDPSMGSGASVSSMVANTATAVTGLAEVISAASRSVRMRFQAEIQHRIRRLA